MVSVIRSADSFVKVHVDVRAIDLCRFRVMSESCQTVDLSLILMVIVDLTSFPIVNVNSLFPRGYEQIQNSTPPDTFRVPAAWVPISVQSQLGFRTSSRHFSESIQPLLVEIERRGKCDLSRL